MTETAAVPPVVHSVEIDVDPGRAFEIYANEIGRWWPRDHHIGEAELEDIVIEGAEDGRVREIGVDGSTCEWGHVKVWEPPHRLVVAWQLNERWQFDPDRGHASEYEVTFVEVGGRTRVTVEYRNFENHGPGGAAIQQAVGGDDGWPHILGRFADHAAG